MNRRIFSLLCSIPLWAHPAVSASDVPPKITVGHRNQSLDLSWPASFPGSNSTLVRPYFELQRSTTLRDWQPVGERIRAQVTVPGQTMSVTPAVTDPLAFYRLLQIPPSTAAPKLAQGGEEVFGYAPAFSAALEQIGQISPEQFAGLFPNQAAYLSSISWDPTTAQFWSEFNADPAKLNQGLDFGQPGYREADFRLSPAELDLFKQNGFVVSEAMGRPSFGELFYNVWHSDLPVFISCDALLQGWHRTYDAILEEVEETFLFSQVQSMLDGMTAQLQAAAAEVGSGVLRDRTRFQPSVPASRRLKACALRPERRAS